MNIEELHPLVQKLYYAIKTAPTGSRATIVSDEYKLVELAQIINDLYYNFKSPNIEIKNKVLFISGEL